MIVWKVSSVSFTPYVFLDLIPRSVAERWLRYLRNEYPTIAFKSSIQHQRDNLVRSAVS